jgi:hypothetical protein
VTGSQKLISLYVGILTLALGSFASSAVHAQEQESPFKIAIDADLVCRQQKPDQGAECPRFTHLNISLRSLWSERLSLLLSWDPGQVDKPTWIDTYGILGQRLPPRKTWFNHYALRWRFSPSLEISLEDWTAATLIPDASGLSFSQALQDSGWNQSVLRLSSITLEGRANFLSLIAGLGEGERLKERDNKPYLGLMGRREIIPALEWQAAWSFDADSLEERQFYWLESSERSIARSGFKSERQALSVILNGQLAKARGLRLALGLQRNLITGPKTISGIRQVRNDEGPFDPTEILAENRGQRSQLERRTLAISGSYLILAEYVLAFHWQRLDLDLGSEASVLSCSRLGLNGSCLDAPEEKQQLQVREFTWGLGRMDEQGWSLFVESFTINYDRLYELYHFAPDPDRRRRSTSIAQARLSWKW